MQDNPSTSVDSEVIELANEETMTCPSCGTDCILTHKYCPGCGFPMEKLREQPDDPLIGRTLPGGHVVLELIDVGGMGRVYRAEQKMLGRTVAVKIIHPHLLGDETVEARFITEARAASQLNHPNSVGVIDFGKFEGRLYMVMEYIRGRDLATVAHEEGPLELERIVDISLTKEEQEMFDTSVKAVQGLIEACKGIDESLA